LAIVVGLTLLDESQGFQLARSHADYAIERHSALFALIDDEGKDASSNSINNKSISKLYSQYHSRRQLLATLAPSATASAFLFYPFQAAHANEFTPGGTLVDYTVGVTVGNPEASPSRKPDNTNVLFDRDYYFKFGTAAPWIAPGSTDFPKTVPFVRVQQRYDALKKYKDRILTGIATIKALETTTTTEIADPAATDVYYLRPMGLLANSFLASENTGSTNELLLARWYINEILLLIGDLRRADDGGAESSSKKQTFGALKKAVNSYLGLMNRVITDKVGDKFQYI